MDRSIVEQIAIDNPDDAESALLNSGRPSQQDIEYLRFLLSKLQGKDNRTIEDSWKQEFHGPVKGVSPEVAEMANQIMGNPPKEEPTHGFHQEQGQRETADPAQESTPGEAENNGSNQE